MKVGFILSVMNRKKDSPFILSKSEDEKMYDCMYCIHEAVIELKGVKTTPECVARNSSVAGTRVATPRVHRSIDPRATVFSRTPLPKFKPETPHHIKAVTHVHKQKNSVSLIHNFELRKFLLFQGKDLPSTNRPHTCASSARAESPHPFLGS